MIRTTATWSACLCALLCFSAACDDDSPPASDDGGLTCAASQQSGVWLLPFGPLTQELLTGGSGSVTVIVTRSSSQEGQGAAMNNFPVSFRIITPASSATLQRPQVSTTADGLAQTAIVAGDQAQVVQVEASAEGTCPVTFTLDVRSPLRQLRAVTPNPYDTFTGSRIPLAVEATTDGFAKLRGETVTFTIGQGKSAETLLTTLDRTQSGGSLALTTDQAGRATAMLETGSSVIAQLVVQAQMAGTAPVQMMVRVGQGVGSGCQQTAQCPLGYACVAGKCEPPPPTPPVTGCSSDKDCAPPTVCQVATGDCLQPTGAPCDPIEGVGCGSGEVCVGRTCAKLPPSCQSNADCPAGWSCVGGQCLPVAKIPGGGCTTLADCPSGQTCINGQCKPKTACAAAHSPDRLQGRWQLDSTLELRQALSPTLSGVLATASVLSDLLQGKLTISGVPKVVTSLVATYLKQLIQQYVPPWGQQLVVTLGEVDDIVDTMRVLSTVQVTSVGNDSYVNNEQWDLVEFEYKGQQISTPPSAIPSLGQVKPSPYGSTEVCGVWFMEKHKVSNVVGGLIKWAIETALSVVTCSVKDLPCYNTVDQALQQTIDCQMLGLQLDQLIQGIWSGAPSVAAVVTVACDSQKQNLVQALQNELNGLTTKLSLMELSGTVPLPPPGSDSQLSGGLWVGVLGTSVAKGNFDGTFSAKRLP